MLLGPQIAVPGITNELPGVNVRIRQDDRQADASGAARDRTLVRRAGGADGMPAVVAITGGLTNQWTLSLAVPGRTRPRPPRPRPKVPAR